ncbi:MAG: HIT domain-containing protein [Cohaesibacter sp.]|nr:HIT domain-containing protein [Cohaesibacter sp.]
MTKTCRFCLSNNLLDDEPLFENASFFVLGMREQARQHAVMIIPKNHAQTPFDLKREDWLGIDEALSFAKQTLAPFNPCGYSIGWNVGASAGQHVSHVHLHVICRFNDQPATGLGLNALIEHANHPQNKDQAAK